MRLVQEHLDVCAQCTREFNFERSVLTGVRSKLSRIAAPPNLLSRIAPFLGRPDPKDAPDAGGSA